MSKHSIASAIDDCMKNENFARSKFTWNRISEKFIDVIAYQKCGNKFTINFGIASKRIYNLVWPEFRNKFVDETKCLISDRVPNLIFGSDMWWDYEQTSISGLKQQIYSTCSTYFSQDRSDIKFLEYITSNNNLSKYPPHSIYALILFHDLGMTAEYKVQFERLSRDCEGPWLSRLINATLEM
jgi:Domain of unknown function (DUF4304)